MTIRTESELLALIDFTGSNITLGKSTIDRQVLRDVVESILTIAGPGAPVSSVFARTGAILALLSDYDASQIDNDSSVAGATVKDALETLAATAGLDNDVIELVEIAGGQVFGVGTSKVTFDTTRINTDSGVFAVAIDEIEVLVAGTYRIDVGLAGDYSGISVLHQIIIRVDLGAGFLELGGTFKELNNNTGTTTGSMHAAANVTLSANDKIQVVIVRLSASGNWTIDGSAGQFSVTRLL